MRPSARTARSAPIGPVPTVDGRRRRPYFGSMAGQPPRRAGGRAPPTPRSTTGTGWSVPTAASSPSARPASSARWGADAQPTHGGNGLHFGRAGLLGGGRRRGHLRLRQGRLLRLDRRPRPGPAHRGHGRYPRRAGLLAGGRRRRASSPSATPPSSGRPAGAARVDRSSGWPPTATGTGYWLVTRAGAVFAFGGAVRRQPAVMFLEGHVVGITPSSDGRGTGWPIRRRSVRLRRRAVLREGMTPTAPIVGIT